MLHHENIFHVQDFADVVQQQVDVLGLGGGIRVRVESLGIHIVVEIVVHQLRIGVLLYLPFGNADVAAQQHHKHQHHQQGDAEQVLENVIPTFEGEAEKTLLDGVFPLLLFFGETQFPNILVKQILRIGDSIEELFEKEVYLIPETEFFF